MTIRPIRAAALVLVLLLAACSDPAPKAVPSVQAPIPAEAAALLGQAQQAFRTGDTPRALQLADQAIGKAVLLPDAHFLKGRVYEQRQQFDAAVAAYGKALEQDANLQGAWYNLGNIAMSQQQFQQARQLYQREAALHPEEAYVWHGLAGAYFELGVMDSARYAVEQALARDAAYAPALSSMADLHRFEGTFDAGVSFAQRAAEAAPDNAGYVSKYGTMLLMAEQYAEAVPVLREAVQRQPGDPEALLNLGRALQQTGRADEAVAFIQQAETARQLQVEITQAEALVRAEPNNLGHQARLAQAYQQAGRPADALRVYRVLETRAPNNLPLLNNIANLYIQQGDTAAARQRLDAILTRDPSVVEAWINRGFLYRVMGQPARAQAAWAEARRLNPNHPSVLALGR
ncbi:MAG: tetratricopeptide repeat protein [Bacteroidota bacterium]